MSWALRGGVGVLLLATLVSALAVVYSTHQSRRLFVELHTLQTERDSLNVDWGRLQLEQGTWATHGRVEQTAREQLEMSTPLTNSVVIITYEN